MPKPPKAPPADALQRVVAPIVRGQILSFLNDHPEIAAAWPAPGPLQAKARGLALSLRKRVVNDLVCAQTRMRLAQALLCSDDSAGEPADVADSASAPAAVETIAAAGMADRVATAAVRKRCAA